MKKAIIIIALVGMFAWAVFDLDYQSINISNSSFNEGIGNNDDGNVGLNIGNIAPDFQLQTINGESVQLSDYRGAHVILNFWNTWCVPCRTEMPDMEKFYQDQN